MMLSAPRFLVLVSILMSAGSARAGMLETVDLVPTPSPSPAPSPIHHELEPSDYDSAGIGVRFQGEKIVVTGRISQECAAGIRMIDVKKTSPEKSPAAMNSLEDLNLHSSHVGVRLRYTSPDGKHPNLASCISASTDARIDLETRSDLSRQVLSGSEVALGGVLTTSNEVVALKSIAQSRSHQALVKQLEDRDCASCNADSRSIQRRLDELASLDFPWVKPLMSSLLESAIAATRASIKSAQTLTALEGMIVDLESYAALADKLGLDPEKKGLVLHSIGEGYTEMLTKNHALAKAGASSKGLKQEGRHVDFMARTYRSMAKLPGIEKEQRESLLQLAKEHEKGGSMRLDFISGLNPSHHEVRNALNEGQEDLMKLAREAQIACSRIMKTEDMMKCGQARQAYQMKLGNLQMLQRRWVDGQRAQFQGNGIKTAGAPAALAPANGLQVYSSFGGPSTFGNIPSVPMNPSSYSGTPIPTAPGLPAFGN
jgi:hypothetical protein